MNDMFNNREIKVNYNGLETSLKPIQDESIKKECSDSSARIQPDVVIERDLAGVDNKGRDLYIKVNKFYKELCSDDVSFCIIFLTPTEQKSQCFFRICDIENQDRFQKAAFFLFSKMFDFLHWGGFIDHLARIGNITINKPFPSKTFLEQIKGKNGKV